MKNVFGCAMCEGKGINAWSSEADEKKTLLLGLDTESKSIVFKLSGTADGHIGIPVKYCPFCGRNLEAELEDAGEIEVDEKDFEQMTVRVMKDIPVRIKADAENKEDIAVDLAKQIVDCALTSDDLEYAIITEVDLK